MKKLLCCLLALSPLAMTSPASTAADNGALASLSFLVGVWHSSVPGSDRGDQFAYALSEKVLTRTVAGNTPTGGPHSVLTIWPDADGKSLRAIYFDDQGHVIHYRSQLLEAGQRVQFVIDGCDPGPLLRLTYDRVGEKLHAKFEMAPRGTDTYRVVAEGDETQAN